MSYFTVQIHFLFYNPTSCRMSPLGDGWNSSFLCLCWSFWMTITFWMYFLMIQYSFCTQFYNWDNIYDLMASSALIWVSLMLCLPHFGGQEVHSLEPNLVNQSHFHKPRPPPIPLFPPYRGNMILWRSVKCSDMAYVLSITKESSSWASLRMYGETS